MGTVDYDSQCSGQFRAYRQSLIEFSDFYVRGEVGLLFSCQNVREHHCPNNTGCNDKCCKHLQHLSFLTTTVLWNGVKKRM